MAEIDVPPYFLCPISLEIMKDPVTIPTGITYDRDSIEKWVFSEGNASCPVTKQPLSGAADLTTPNVTLRRLIQSWCTLHAAHGVQRLPTPKPPVTRSQLTKLLNDTKAAPQIQIKSLQTLRSIASQNQTNRISMENAGVADFLASLIVDNTLHQSSRPESSGSDPDPDLSGSRKACEEAVAILYALQLSESSLEALAQNPEFPEALTRLIPNSGYESRVQAIIILRSMLESSDPTRQFIPKSEFYLELAEILRSQDVCQNVSKAVLKILICTTPWGRNRVKAVEAGLVPVLVDLLLNWADKRACELGLIALDLLCQCADGRSELINHGAGLAIVSKKILRVSNSASERGVRILHSVSRFSGTPGVLQEMLQMGVVAKLCLVLQVDSGPKTKERARDILRMHARTWRASSCIPTGLVSAYPS
ncbi:U-box domain-containing family protein [Striga asiatica]|uniref:U-box domain-containing protein n=1 Tax=Striga asiatica TaxID=4170 RepID=A0A5A7P8B5_STRAF|nr:U-box domain-containing family protein [Striga asiatica]